MTNINWANFKSKFYEKESKVFENLAYLLFCREFEIDKGLFRFKNQTGIETDPIDHNGQRIGFQAKYYDTKIADNKKDIMDSMAKAKKKDDAITTIHVYLNQEFSESRKKNVKVPAYKTEMETFASKIGISVVWKVPSHFEVMLSQPGYKHIADYFFGLGKNAVDFLTEIQAHTQNVLFPIQYRITTQDKELKIDRGAVIKKVMDDKSGIVILSGEGGCGKTAVIKQIAEQTNSALYVFKAIEFNVTSIAAFLKSYGDYSLNDFVELHRDQNDKIMVIDSAEKLSDLENQDPFKEFLSALLKDSWKLIFTTRLSYLEDLRYQFVEVYQLPFQTVKLENLQVEELENLSAEYQFQLPDDKKVLALISNLFYLDEYLSNLEISGQKQNFQQFKETLWKKKIQHSDERKNNIHIERERCFMLLAKKRAQKGTFYNDMAECSGAVLAKLESDEVIKYDAANAGYFITHDIYEEWALNRFVDTEFMNSADYTTFFETIGTSLAVRRAFRTWLSDRLGDDIQSVHSFIENVILAKNLTAFWKDEMIIAILSSNYSESFFDTFSEKILDDGKSILKRILFLLQIGCMEVQDLFLKNTTAGSDLPFLLTGPKGEGWSCTIKFLLKNKEKFDHSEAGLICAVLKIWTDNNRKGLATRDAGLLSLYFYDRIPNDTGWRYSADLDKRLQEVILSSAIEIKGELLNIYDPILKQDNYKYGDKYYGLTAKILTSTFEIYPIITVLPKLVISLAEKVWFKSENYKPDRFEYDGHGVEKYYGLHHGGLNEYFPASALQTPTYLLLKHALKDTVDFILCITNKAIEKYANANVEQIKEVELVLDNGVKVKQYVSENLWQMYRGSGQLSTPYLLQSVHMALEKFFLENYQDEHADIWAKWLIYMLKNSRSASITGLVASIAIAHPEKLFNVLKILFRTPRLFYYDNVRATSEARAKSLYSYGFGLDHRTKIFDTERIETCGQPHRKHSLEQIALMFQVFKTEAIPDEEFEFRKTEVHHILDEYYRMLPKKYVKDDEFYTLRLLLARLDSRKMKPIVKDDGHKVLISFDAEMDPKLKKDSEAKVEHNFRNMKYLSLKQWAEAKLKETISSVNNPQYDDNPSLALEETKLILKKLNSNPEEEFHLFNHSTPAYVCSALVQCFSEALTIDELNFCKEVVAAEVVSAFQENYQYQIGDGVEVAVNTLPHLIKLFPDDRDNLCLLLLVILFDEYKLGEYKRVCDYAVEAILNKLWQLSFEDAQIIFLAFLKLKPGFDLVREEVRKGFRHTGMYQKSIQSTSVEQWFEDNQAEIEKCLTAPLDYSAIQITDIGLQTLNSAFHMIPSDSTDETHNRFVISILPKACDELLDRDKFDKDFDRRDYTLGHRFFRKYAAFILRKDVADIPEMIMPLIENFQYTEEMADVLQEFITEEDTLNSYEAFWVVWKSFYEPIKLFCQSGVNNRFLDKLVDNYFFAWPYWKESAKDWRSLKDRERLFFRSAVVDMGQRIVVLHAISKFLNQIGAKFLDDGIIWISDMLKKHPEHVNVEAPVNTVYYLERVVRKYVYQHRTSIKTKAQLRTKTLIILDYLIEKGSVNAYLLREDIV
jgi:ATPase family associated with various cellular activities (AAA)